MIKSFLTSSPHIAYLTKRKSLSNHQSGNRKNHSTETLNVAFTDTLLEAMDKKQISIVVFIDLSKAFDSIKHDILLEKISRAIWLTDRNMFA